MKIEDPHMDYYSSNDHSSDSGEESNHFKLTEPSPSSDFHEQGGPPSNKQVTVALITDCLTTTVHAGKCYKALIDLGAAISLIRYSTYQSIDSSLKTTIQATTTKLNMANGSLMTALGKTALHLRIVYFKFTHSSVICNRLLDTEKTVWN